MRVFLAGWKSWKGRSLLSVSEEELRRQVPCHGIASMEVVVAKMIFPHPQCSIR